MIEYDDFCSLMCRVGEGDDDAAWELVSRYGAEIRRTVRRMLQAKLRPKFDSLDFVQLVWQSFFRVRDKCNRFHHPEELGAYLAKMAKSKVKNEARRRFTLKKYNVRHELSLNGIRTEDMECRQPAPIDVAIARERWDQILKSQPAHYQRIIQLRLEGNTYEDIGKAVHVTERTICRFFKKLLHTHCP